VYNLHPVNRVQPNEDVHRCYEPYVRVYKGLFEALRPSFEVIRAAKAKERT